MNGAEQVELYFHAAEIVLIILGMAVPAWITTVQLRRILRDFPPHRHSHDGTITYPKDFEPPREQQLFRTQAAGK